MKSEDDKRPDIDQSHSLLEFPEGDGDPDCPLCHGRGVISAASSFYGIHWPGAATQACKCVYKRDLEANVKRIWPVLLNVESCEDSPLLKLTKQNLWITANGYDLRQHLRFTAYRMPPSWDAKVITDSKIITSWLANANEVYDPDVAYEKKQSSLEYFTIEDIAVPFGLLIIVLGVKAAKNREMPNVLLEAINEREMRGKPTWIVDSPSNPLAQGHICYNDSVMEVLEGFRRVKLSEPQTPHYQTGYHNFSMAAAQARRPARQQPPASRPQQRQAPPATAPQAPAAGSVYLKRKPGMEAGLAAPRYVPPPPPPKPGAGDPSKYADDDLSVDAMLGSALDLTPEDIRATVPDVFDEDDETIQALMDEEMDRVMDEDPEYLDAAREAERKPKPKGRRKFRP
jgi:hypothetical protein